jgi:hypothetical protein
MASPLSLVLQRECRLTYRPVSKVDVIDQAGWWFRSCGLARDRVSYDGDERRETLAGPSDLPGIHCASCDQINELLAAVPVDITRG